MSVPVPDPGKVLRSASRHLSAAGELVRCGLTEEMHRQILDTLDVAQEQLGKALGKLEGRAR